MPESQDPNQVSNNDLRNSQFGGGLINAEAVNAQRIGGDIYNIHIGQQTAASGNPVQSQNQQHLLEQERDSLEKAYSLQSQKVAKIRTALIIETDPSRKFQYEYQLQEEERTLNELVNRLNAIEQQLSSTKNSDPQKHTNIYIERLPNESRDRKYTKHQVLEKPPYVSDSDFFGRKKEIAILKKWIVNDRCRMVAILGQGGIGKSSLAAYTAQQIQDNFDYIIWMSLLNAPPVEDILAELLRFLSQNQDTNLPENLDDKVSQLIKYFRRQRCLLILDNAEVILRSGDRTGQYEEGYEGYSKLLRSVGEEFHQSCLVLTSREKPKEIGSSLGKQTKPVRSLQLTGLNKLDGKRIFTKLGRFSGSENDWKLVIENYSGNPLALNIAASTIKEIMNSNISLFVERYLIPGSLPFKEINDILERQVNRLPYLEKAIMYWLAINREPVSNWELTNDIFSVADSKELIEPLLSLKRRMLIEKNSDNFTLQPVVMEYITKRLINQVCLEIETGKINEFNSYALLKAQSKDFIRATQIRLIIEPIIKKLQLQNSLNGKINVERHLKNLISKLQEEFSLTPGYAGGNILNILCKFNTNLTSYNFSNLAIWQAFLQDVNLYQVDFTNCDLANSVFAQTFGSILAVAFSPNGQYLAAGDAKGEIRLWQTEDGQPVMLCKGHTSWLRSIAFSPDGETLLSSSDDHTVRIWDIRTGKCLKILREHTNHVSSIAFSSDGLTIASGSSDTTIRLWNCRTGKCLKILQMPEHIYRVWSVAFSPDGQMLASADENQNVKVWDVNTGQCLRTLEGHTKGVFSVAFSSQGKILASGSDDETVRIWDINTGECLKILHVPEHIYRVWSVAFSPDGQHLISGSEDQKVRVWDVNTGQCLRTLEGHTSWVWAVAFSPNGQTLASGSDDHTVKIWDVNTDQCLKTFQGYTSEVRSVAFSPDGQKVISGSEDHKVRVWDVDTGECLRTLNGHTSRVWSVAFSPSRGRQILASGSDDDTVKLWDADTGECLKTLQQPNRWVQAVTFSPDGQILASSDDAIVKLWYVGTGECFRDLKGNEEQEGHSDWVWSVAFSPNGQTLASGSDDCSVRLWDITTGRCLKIFEGHNRGVRSVAFSQNGQILASGSDDRTIRIWNVKTGRCLKVLEGHSDWVWSVALSPDSITLASGSQDQMVRLWNIETGRCVRILQGHTHWIRSVAFNPDGEILASGSPDETIKLWEVNTGRCRKTLRAKRPYEGMKIRGITALTEVQKATLKALGAVED
jgi:WD40 repeat protein